MERNTLFLKKPKISNASLSQKKSNVKKSVLKSSKSKIEEHKKKIFKIIEDNLILSKIKTLQAKNDLMFYNSSNEAQNNFEENIDKLFKEKMDKLNEINKKYDTEIYELKQDIDEEDIIKAVAGNEDGIIGDLCMGRGLVACAAAVNKKKFVGTELNPKRLAVCLERLDKI